MKKEIEMAKTVLTNNFVQKVASKKTCEASDFDAFVAEAARRGIDRSEASKLFAHWRGHRVLREHMLNSSTWRITESQIWFSEDNLGRAMTAYYR